MLDAERPWGYTRSRTRGKSVCLLHSALSSRPPPCLSRDNPDCEVTWPERYQCKQGRRCQRDLRPPLGPWEEGGQPGSVSPEQNSAIMRNASPPVYPGSYFCAHVKSQEESTPGHAIWGSDLTRKSSAARLLHAYPHDRE